MNVIIGRKPVLEALNAGDEIQSVHILFNQHGNILDAIRIAAKKRGIKCSLAPVEKFKSITSDPAAQGVAAIKSDYKFFSVDEVCSEVKNSSFPLLLILDSIQDPHNVGAILRTSECAGVKGALVTKHNSAPINETVNRISTGAVNILKIAQVNNLAHELKLLKEKGFWICGSALENSVDYKSAKFPFPLALILGNEEKGIRKLTADNCDLLVNIPMKGKLQSLNVSVAAGVLLFEIAEKFSAS